MILCRGWKYLRKIWIFWNCELRRRIKSIVCNSFLLLHRMLLFCGLSCTYTMDCFVKGGGASLSLLPIRWIVRRFTLSGKSVPGDVFHLWICWLFISILFSARVSLSGRSWSHSEVIKFVSFKNNLVGKNELCLKNDFIISRATSSLTTIRLKLDPQTEESLLNEQS